jgi:hypothetical protein
VKDESFRLTSASTISLTRDNPETASNKRNYAKWQSPPANYCPLQMTFQINQSLIIFSTEMLNSFKKIE